MLSTVSPDDVARVFAERANELHSKVDATRDAYFGFIFPVNRRDLNNISDALGLTPEVARSLYQQGTSFSTFSLDGRRRQITNHIVGSSLLALRGKDLDTGLSSVTSESVEGLVRENEDSVLEIASARASWFGRIYFPAVAFENAIGVFGGDASAESLFALAKAYGYASEAGARFTIRGDFGIAVWLTLLATAP